MFTINTYIKDIDTREPLPFASVVVTDRKGNALPINGVPVVGRKSDENGKVIIPVAIESAYITVSYVGYITITHPASDYVNDIIYLKNKETNPLGNSKEVVIKAKRPKPNKSPLPVRKPNKKPFNWLLVVIPGAIIFLLVLIILLTQKK